MIVYLLDGTVLHFPEAATFAIEGGIVFFRVEPNKTETCGAVAVAAMSHMAWDNSKMEKKPVTWK